MGAYDRWFEHAGYVDGTFFDNEADGCVWPWDDSPKGPCQTKTFRGGIWAGKGDGYDTSTAGNKTVDWIKQQASGDRPWFVYYAPHAPHSPATPAPWYETGTFCDNVTAPRLPNFNYSGSPRTSWTTLPPSGPPPFGNEPVEWWNGTEFHELVSSSPFFTEKDVEAIDDLAQHRCKSLLSVDDSYRAILEAAAADTRRKTYVLVTSDHGYNLGNHMLPSNKFLLYEHSMRIPMVFQGPGIAANSSFEFMGTNVDVAPTILELAGIEPPASIDGRSVVPYLISDPSAKGVPGSVQRSLSRNPSKPARTDQFVTYFSQGDWIVDGRPLDDWSNTYIGVTHRDDDGHYKFGIYDVSHKKAAKSMFVRMLWLDSLARAAKVARMGLIRW